MPSSDPLRQPDSGRFGPRHNAAAKRIVWRHPARL